MNFATAARLGTYLSKEYAENFFGLLLRYQDISASESASRLGLHIRTAQEFLDGLAELGILGKQEVYEKKRPYYRYALKTRRILIDLDLTQIQMNQTPKNLTRCIREKANARANFSLARGGEFISYITFWIGDGREGKERKISLTKPQGLFLYHLPFPNAEFLSISDIIHKAGLGEEVAPEILDILDVLEQYGIIETEVHSE